MNYNMKYHFHIVGDNIKDDLIPSGVQAVERAIAILELVASYPDPVKLVQISDDLNLNKNTVYRLARALVALDYLDAVERGYVLGPKPLILSRSTTLDALLLRKSEPYMQELCDTTKEITNLGISRKDEVFYLSRWEAVNPQPGLYIRMGERAPLYASALGKVLLAGMSHERREVYYRQCPFKKISSRTIVDPDELETNVQEVIRNGFARDLEEVNAGVRCVAVPLRVHGTTVAALSISFPTARFTREAEERYVSFLAETSNVISQELRPYFKDDTWLEFGK